MNAGTVLIGVRRGSSVLHRTGWTCLALVASFALLGLFDASVVDGVGRWSKPLKFALSFWVYAWTLGLLFEDLRLPRGWQAALIAVTVATIATEQALITLQAARGVASHFNDGTRLDAVIYRTMGVAIGLNALALAAVLPLSFVGPRGAGAALLRPGLVDAPEDRAGLRRWGWRLGIAVFLLGCATGGVMVARRGHAVSLPADAHAVLPLFGWHLAGGDLRIAHFLGIHGLQALPLVAYGLERVPHWSARRRLIALFAAAAVYLAVGAAVFARAMVGLPPWDASP